MTVLDTPTRPAPPPSPVETTPAFVDAWPWAQPARLTGWFERERFSPILTALLVFVTAFILFQVVVSPIVIAIGVVIEMTQSGQQTPPDMSTILSMVMENGKLLMTANTVGQIVGFALLALAAARLHTPDVREFLRIRKADVGSLALAAVGWAVLYPAILWTGQLNGMLPLPEWLRTLEQQQVDLLEGLLLGDTLSTGFLFIALALTPAICEELLFRGYLQRQVERRWGAVTSIVLVGVLFGLYHLRLSQAIPLSLLGIYMGYVVWATGSLWAGFLVHILNNGLAVAATAVAKNDPDLDLEAIESLGVPWYFGIAGLVLCAAVSRALVARRQSLVGTAQDAQPVVASPSLSPLSPSSHERTL